MKVTLAVILSVAILASTGCSLNSAPTTAPASQLQSQSLAMPTPAAQGEPYDFYLLNLSWSPEFCYTHPTSPECAAHPGFVVHGLWPQRNDGTYPQHCQSRPGPTSDAAWQGLMPTASLAQHEWQTHGTCTPYNADAYFGLIRKAFNEVHIPAAFTHPTAQTMASPAAILAEFTAANPTFPPASLALSCGHNYLTAIEVCFDKSLNPTACTGIRTCRANQVKITPR